MCVIIMKIKRTKFPIVMILLTLRITTFQLTIMLRRILSTSVKGVEITVV